MVSTGDSVVCTHRSPIYLPRKQREIGGCGSTAVCRLSASATLTRTTSELNDSRQVHSLPLKHLRPRVLKQPPHYLFIFTLFGAAGCGKQAENIHQFSFASKARLFSLRYITSCGVFFFSWFYCPQNKPEAGVDGNYSSRTPADYLDLSDSCVVHSRTITFIITSRGLETKGGKNEKGITSSKRYCDSVMFTFSVV